MGSVQQVMMAALTSSSALLPPITTNLILDWDARSITVPDGTSLITGDWLDQSSTHNNPVNGNPSNRPVYRATGGPSSLPTVQFNGLGAFALTSSITSSDRTYFAVVKCSDSNPRTIISGDTGSLQYRIYLNKQNVLKASVVDYGSSSTSLGTTTFYSTNVTFNQTTRAFVFRISAGADGSGTGGGTSPSANVTDVGARSATELFLGYISLVLAYDTILSGADISTIESWITGIWGV